MSSSSRRSSGRLNYYGGLILVSLALYVLSSGPVLALGCWLRDKTDNNLFYAVIFLYVPLGLVLRHCPPLEAYIAWWMHVFGTAFPG